MIRLRLEKQDNMPSVHSIKIIHQYAIKIKNNLSATWMHLCDLFLDESVTKIQLNAFVLKILN